MSRWKPGARARIEEAALELFIKHGFEGVTVSEIAARAGLTERTFFRHFADKREVLFGGQKELQASLVDAISAAPSSVAPLDAVAQGLREGAGAIFEERRDQIRRRQTVLDTVAGLKEREMLKLAALSEVIAGALRDRGVAATTATLSAEMGIVLFKIAFDRWIDPANEREFAEFIGETLDQLKAVSAP